MPKMDCEERKIESGARGIVHYQFNPNHWDFKEETGKDVGRDCIVELSENDEWKNHKIEGQIKGTKALRIVDGNSVSYPMPVSTIEYALGSSISFVLFVVDVIQRKTYCQCIQEFFINHVELFEKLDQKTINIRIPLEQVLEECDALLISWARKVFVGGPGKELKEYDIQAT